MLEKSDRSNTFLSRLHSIWILAAALPFIALLGYLDYLSGFEISFSFFYLIPISLTVLYANVISGFLIAAISIIVWAVSNQLAGQIYSSEIILYWNALIRFVTFSLITILLNQQKSMISHEQGLARMDDLTGIFNRREFHRLAQMEIKRASRYNQKFTLAYIDLDRFKEINDRLGHSTGDKLLQTVADTLKLSLRRTDTIARLGGDEFVILLPEIDAVGARCAIEKVRNNLSEKMARIGLETTFSIGAVHYSIPPGSVNEMLERADRLMYSAKTRDKDEIVFEEKE